MRQFNTSGPNIPEQHYTVQRTALVDKGQRLVEDERYFTIWAPRQTGKSTYFRQLAERLGAEGYDAVHINFEESEEVTCSMLTGKLWESFELSLKGERKAHSLVELFEGIKEHKHSKLVLIIEHTDRIVDSCLTELLHNVRSAYHCREMHGLKSVILSGTANVLAQAGSDFGFFNVADDFDFPYFTDEEVFSLLGQHEAETGQRLDTAVKEKICQITANQPGLVNGFAHQLVERYPDKPVLALEDYLEVENWYLTKAIDKNISNIINKAKEYRPFIERLLYTDAKVPFRINDEAIKFLHANGLLTWDEEDKVSFWVPLYKKALYDAFYPYTNVEKKSISRTVYRPDYFTETGELRLDKIIEKYKAYAKRRGFNPFREKDEQGNYKSIPEAALVYSFETYIYAVVEELGGKIYREAHVGLGRSDLIINGLDATGRRGGKNELFLPQPKAFSGRIAALRAPKKAQAGGKTAILPPRGSRRIKSNIDGAEFLVETKVYYSPGKFETGKKQLAYYCNSLGLSTGVYLVFCPNNIRYPEVVREGMEVIDGVEVRAYLVEYDEETW